MSDAEDPNGTEDVDGTQYRDGSETPETVADDDLDGVLSPGSTATGAGTTEADVSDGREQKLPRID